MCSMKCAKFSVKCVVCSVYTWLGPREAAQAWNYSTAHCTLHTEQINKESELNSEHYTWHIYYQ